MSDRGILFSAPMVKALIREVESPGTGKTQTRRLANSPLRRCALGDQLWVRETWKPHSTYARVKPILIPDSNVFFAADGKYAPSNTPWVPAIHMPRKFSRLTLTVTDVRFQSLKEISEADAKAEGVQKRYVEEAGSDLWFGVYYCGNNSPIEAYFDLWDSLHNPHGYCAEDAPGGSAANPSVVALTFTVEQRNIDR